MNRYRLVEDCIYNSLRNLLPVELPCGSTYKLLKVDVQNNYITSNIQFNAQGEKSYPPIEYDFHISETMDSSNGLLISMYASLPFMLKRCNEKDVYINYLNSNLQHQGFSMGEFSHTNNGVEFEWKILIDNINNLPNDMPHIIQNLLINSVQGLYHSDTWHLHSI